MAVGDQRSIKSPSKRVHAVGSYGFGNFGDELFVATVLENACALWPEASVRTFVPRWDAYASSSILGKALRLGVGSLGLAWADTIAMCGGSILQDSRGVARVRQAFMRWRRTEALGVSVGPFSTGDASVRVGRTLRGMDRVVVRDRASVERIRQLGMNIDPPPVGGDLVALSGRIEVARQPPPGEVITICPSAASTLTGAVLVRHVVTALDRVIAETGATPRIRLLALSQHPSSNDVPLCSALADAAVRAGFDVTVATFDALGLDGTIKAIAGSSMVWSQRLHGAIVAYLTGVPFLLVGHHAKCIDFACDIGVPDRTIVHPDEGWELAAAILLTGVVPSLSPTEYRARARAQYLRCPGGGPAA